MIPPRVWYALGFLGLQLLATLNSGWAASLEEPNPPVSDVAGSDPAPDLHAELLAQQQQLVAVKEETAKKELELEKRLNSLEQSSVELKQLLLKIASVANKDSGNVTKTAAMTAGTFSAEETPKIELTMTATGGVNYVRWGRTTCEADATVVYTGFAASGGPNTGGTSDIVCLHPEPEVRNTFAGGTVYSQLHVVEYEFAKAPFQTRNNRNTDLLNHDMPCAVCHVSTRTSQIMVPGRVTCPSGWVSEYFGYLVSTRYSGYKGAMICVDEAPESTNGGMLSDAAALSIHPVEIKCGGTHCPPYGADNEITCAVCSM